MATTEDKAWISILGFQNLEIALREKSFYISSRAFKEDAVPMTGFGSGGLLP